MNDNLFHNLHKNNQLEPVKNVERLIMTFDVYFRKSKIRWQKKGNFLFQSQRNGALYLKVIIILFGRSVASTSFYYSLKTTIIGSYQRFVLQTSQSLFNLDFER